jgi:uncharacterized protein (TIGR02271 family)
MINTTELQNVIGRHAVDVEGDKIGKIGQVYLDDTSGEPVWITVSTGLFGTKESFAPLHGASLTADDTLALAVSKSMVKDAPNVDADGHLEDSENDALYAYYNGYLAQGAERAYDQTQYTDTGRTDLSDQDDVVGRDTSGPTTDEAMTRSEERLHVGTETVETGRARLRKYIVTENVTTTVPVSHEEIRVEREPITDANRDQALAGGDLTEEEHEVTLHAERPIVAKETVPVERVRLSTDTVTEQQDVTEEVRKEQIEQVGDDAIEHDQPTTL